MITLAAKWSMTQGQEGRVYVETQGGGLAQLRRQS